MPGILQIIREAKEVAMYRGISMLIMAVTALTFSTTASAADIGLIDTIALKDNAAKWVILDARPKAAWAAAHIPGAFSFSWDNLTRINDNGVKFSSFSPQELARILANMGIDEKTPLVVYGDADKSWGGEGYDIWLFSWLGHKGPIRLLNGGIQAWRSQNLPLVKGEEKPIAPKTEYRIELKPRYTISTEEIQQQKSSFTLVDVRSTFEWIRGKIPGAVHIPWNNFHTGKENRPLTSNELQTLFSKHGVDISRPVVYYCTGGIRSAYAWLTHQLSGLPEARNYKGGWAAWEKRGVTRSAD